MFAAQTRYESPLIASQSFPPLGKGGFRCDMLPDGDERDVEDAVPYKGYAKSI